jgi:hypothetical protein
LGVQTELPKGLMFRKSNYFTHRSGVIAIIEKENMDRVNGSEIETWGSAFSF